MLGTTTEGCTGLLIHLQGMLCGCNPQGSAQNPLTVPGNMLALCCFPNADALLAAGTLRFLGGFYYPDTSRDPDPRAVSCYASALTRSKAQQSGLMSTAVNNFGRARVHN